MSISFEVKHVPRDKCLKVYFLSVCSEKGFCRRVSLQEAREDISSRKERESEGQRERERERERER